MSSPRTHLQKFHTQLSKLQETQSIPNYIISIVHPSGNITLAKGPKTDENTLFPIGSMSKAFAATLIGILVDKNFLNWNDSIHQHVKIKLPNDIDLTISQLLRQINPFPEHALTEASELGFSRQELLNKLQHITITSSYKFSYQNVLFSLIADIVENVTGKSYEECLRQEILIPLSMSTTTVEEKSYLKNKNKASPYINDNNKIVPISYSPYWHILGPPAGVSSSSKDLTQWLKFNLQLEDSKLISKESLNGVHRPLKESQPPYAMGWWEADEQKRVLCHTGSVTGFESAVAIIPSQKIGIAACANLSENDFTREAINIFIQNVLDEKEFNCLNVLKLQMPLAHPKLNLNKFTGYFFHPILDKMKVSQKNNNLTLELGRNKTLATLSPIALLKSHSKMTPELAELAPHHCFQISWQRNMEASGKIYYNEDKIAFVANQQGEIDKLLLLAEAISKLPLSCDRLSVLSTENKESFKEIKHHSSHHSSTTLDKVSLFKSNNSSIKENKKQCSNRKGWLIAGFFAFAVGSAFVSKALDRRFTP